MAESLREQLGRPGILIKSEHVELSIGSLDDLRRFSEALVQSESISSLQFEGLLGEIVEDRALVRELAANLGAYRPELVRRLQSMCSAMETARAGS